MTQTKEERKAYNKEYRIKNRDRIQKREKAYQLANVESRKVKSLEYRQNNLEKIRAYNIEYYKTHKDAKDKYRHEHPEVHRAYDLKRLYGITIEGYDNLLAEQGGKCAICGRNQDEFRKALFVDHDHDAGNVRGLLCSNCNLILGHSHDNIDLLQKTIDYIIERTTNG